MRANVAEADFVHAGFTTLDLEPGSFAAVAAFYACNVHEPEPEGEAVTHWVLATR